MSEPGVISKHPQNVPEGPLAHPGRRAGVAALASVEVSRGGRLIPFPNTDSSIKVIPDGLAVSGLAISGTSTRHCLRRRPSL